MHTSLLNFYVNSLNYILYFCLHKSYFTFLLYLITLYRSNTGTHPTTATQTRSTSRPHVFHHHAHPVGLGMSIGLGLDFDPYLPCNSHHVYRTPTSATTSGNTTTGVTTSQTTRTTSTVTTDAQNQTSQTGEYTRIRMFLCNKERTLFANLKNIF